MIRSVKTMFLLSLGLLCVSVGTVIRAEDGEEKSVATSVATQALEEANRVLEMAQKSGSEAEIAKALEEVEKAKVEAEGNSGDVTPDDVVLDDATPGDATLDDATPGEEEPGYVSSFWNGTCKRTNSICTFIGANRVVSVFSLIGLYATLNWINSVCNSCEESCVRRRPRFSGSDNEN